MCQDKLNLRKRNSLIFKYITYFYHLDILTIKILYLSKLK